VSISKEKTIKNGIIYLYRNIPFLLFLYTTISCNYVDVHPEVDEGLWWVIFTMKGTHDAEENRVWR
jgi:hypothetical protein